MCEGIQPKFNQGVAKGNLGKTDRKTEVICGWKEKRRWEFSRVILAKKGNWEAASWWVVFLLFLWITWLS